VEGSKAGLPRHIHETFQIMLVEAGAQEIVIAGQHRSAPVGSIVVVHPEEAHSEGPARGQSWSARAFYPNLSMVLDAARSGGVKATGTPCFDERVIHDPDLAAILSRLHRLMESTGRALERQTLAIMAAAKLLSRHGRRSAIRAAPACGDTPIRRVLECLQDRYTEDLALEELAAVAGLSTFHLVRTFARVHGMPPHAYLLQIRIFRARALLFSGQPIADVAASLGFTDQSHFTRSFKRLLGVTPGQYARSARLYKTHRSR
jgi:AraC-like DNA-binding protein